MARCRTETFRGKIADPANPRRKYPFHITVRRCGKTVYLKEVSAGFG